MQQRTNDAASQQTRNNEDCCGGSFGAQRWAEVFVGGGWGGRRVWPLASRCRLLECPYCGRETSVTAGTILHRSKLPLQTWFWAAHLLEPTPTVCRHCS